MPQSWPRTELPLPALCWESDGLKTTNEPNEPPAPFGFTPMEPGFANWIRRFLNPRSPGLKPGGDEVFCSVVV